MAALLTAAYGVFVVVSLYAVFLPGVPAFERLWLLLLDVYVALLASLMWTRLRRRPARLAERRAVASGATHRGRPAAQTTTVAPAAHWWTDSGTRDALQEARRR